MSRLNFNNKFFTKNFAPAKFDLRFYLGILALALLSFSSLLLIQKTAVQTRVNAQVLPPTSFRIGERLTYSFSFEKYNNVAYAETYVVSRGLLGERDAVELRSKFKTLDILSATFYMIDETRTTFAAADTGLPLYIRRTSNVGVSPKEIISNYTATPTTNFDLLTLIYQVRNAGGIGSFSLMENDRIYTVTFQPLGTERVKTGAGDFETNIVTVQSEYLTENGIQNLRINFSVDEARIPAVIRFNTAKGEFRGSLSSIQNLENEPGPSIAASTPTPRPTVTPKPIVTPTPYIDNQPLLQELPFDLGETLEYQLSRNGQREALITLQAKERKFINGQDSLLLTATVTGIDPSNQLFVLNDSIRANVNPDSLAPQQILLKFGGFFSSFNQSVTFDQKNGTAIFNNAQSTEVPVGTHSILSFVYALRSFNLKPSKDPNNPVNDTRVAVFIGTQAYVFTLRPSNADIITLQNEKVSAQLISITTGNPQIDLLQPRLWLGNDDERVPLRLTIGTYQADLISKKQISPK